MKKAFYSISLLAILGGCAPESRLYYTPPVYYAKEITVPSVDSNVKFLAGASIGAAVKGNMSAIVNVGKHFYSAAYFGFNGKGFGDKKSAESLDGAGFDYYNQFRAAEIEIGFKNHLGRSHHSWFVGAGFGKGNAHSMVYETTGDVIYHYSGNFSKVFVQTGLMFSMRNKNPKNSSFFIPAVRYSDVKFIDHYSPEGSFHDQTQRLFDCSIQFYQRFNKVRLYFAAGRHVNGVEWGNRSHDGRYTDWRIEPWYASFGAAFHLFKRSQ